MDFEGDTVHSVQFSHVKPQSSSAFSHVWVKLGRSLPTGAKHFLGLITTLSATAGILLNPVCSFNWTSFVHAEEAFGKCTYCHMFISYQAVLDESYINPRR